TMDESVLHFKTNKWAIPKDGEPALDAAIAKLNQYHALNINIVGFTDSTDGAKWNAILSQRRADSVKNYFLAHGIDASRIESVTGKGPADPIADNKTREGRSKNRRVEITAVAPVEVPAE
ncbi:MAG: OmpA family protein, partial [Acidobacteriota bacterium]